MGQGQGPFLLLPVGIAQHSIAGVWKCCSLVAGQALTAASRLLTIGQGLKVKMAVLMWVKVPAEGNGGSSQSCRQTG